MEELSLKGIENNYIPSAPMRKAALWHELFVYGENILKMKGVIMKGDIKTKLYARLC